MKHIMNLVSGYTLCKMLLRRLMEAFRHGPVKKLHQK
jgi:hypothetical protein